MRISLTGEGVCIGSHLVKDRHEVTGIDNLHCGRNKQNLDRYLKKASINFTEICGYCKDSLQGRKRYSIWPPGPM